MATAGAKAQTQAELQTIALGKLQESQTNPRKTFEAKALAELTRSIQEKGVVNPLLVRPFGEQYEVVCGARRLRAAKAAGATAVPCIVRELSDVEALEIQVIENLQRADVHALEEAEGYRQLLKAGRGYDVAAIAAKTGKSESYVYQRLKLGELIPAAKKAFAEGTLAAGHAILLARLQPKDQTLGLEYCQDEGWDGPCSVRDLGDWIQREIHLDLRRKRREALRGVPGVPDGIADRQGANGEGAMSKPKREPSNARVESQGMWTRLRPSCHSDANFQVTHSTTHGIYEVQCERCGQTFLRVEVRRSR